MKILRAALRCLLAGMTVSAPHATAATLAEYPFRLLVAGENGEKHLVARNLGDTPVSLLVIGRDARGTPTPPWPVTLVIPQHKNIVIGRIGRASTVHYSYFPGRMDAPAQAQPCYHAPFAGHGFPVTQAPGGRLTSHDNDGSRYAVDFAMPEDTPVLAARAGIVGDVSLMYRAGGLHRSFLGKGNRVIIVHDDGTLAEYAHLAPRPPLVRSGQRVAVGARIASSGNTGYTSGSHLHFGVAKPGLLDGKMTALSIPFRFCNPAAPPRVAGPVANM